LKAKHRTLNIEDRASNKAKTLLTPSLCPSDGERETTAVPLWGSLVALALVFISAGCVTKSKAKEDAITSMPAAHERRVNHATPTHQNSSTTATRAS